jgi:hypothetical protein
MPYFGFKTRKKKSLKIRVNHTMKIKYIIKHSNELKYKTIIFIRSEPLYRINLEFNYLKTTKERRK